MDFSCTMVIAGVSRPACEATCPHCMPALGVVNGQPESTKRNKAAPQSLQWLALQPTKKSTSSPDMETSRIALFRFSKECYDGYVCLLFIFENGSCKLLTWAFHTTQCKELNFKTQTNFTLQQQFHFNHWMFVGELSSKLTHWQRPIRIWLEN